MPDDDQGEFNVNVRLPRGTSYHAHRRIRQADREGDPGVAGPAAACSSQVGTGNANFNITMTPLEERTISQQEMMRRVRGDAAQVPGRPRSACQAGPTSRAPRPAAAAAAAVAAAAAAEAAAIG